MFTIKKYFVKTFGCQMNVADSERLETYLKKRGLKKTKRIKDADYVIINTCMVRASAEHRVYGLVQNLQKSRQNNGKPSKIVITGCMIGSVLRDKHGKALKRLKEKLPFVDEFLPITEIGFDYIPDRYDMKKAYVPISNGCNNFCSFCIVPFTRGREVSRPFQEIITECKNLKKEGYEEILLIGQNVNSYGSDLIQNSPVRDATHSVAGGNVKSHKFNLQRKIPKVKPVFVKHLGRYRIPTLFPYLLERVAKLGFQKVDFISVNPWDFSEELIDTINHNKNITRHIHLALQSGNNEVLKRMNRWYTIEEYIALIKKIRKRIPHVTFGTDIIVGFPGETEKAFLNTVELCKKIGFKKAFVSQYSPRPYTQASKIYEDDVSHEDKERRWRILDKLINS